MTRPARRHLASVCAVAAIGVLPCAAVAAPPVGECPSSFYEASVDETPVSFQATAAKIDANDDLIVCFKPMANETRTNVIDNIAHAR